MHSGNSMHNCACSKCLQCSSKGASLPTIQEHFKCPEPRTIQTSEIYLHFRMAAYFQKKTYVCSN